MNNNPHRKNLYNSIMELSRRHSVWGAFSDFLALSALCIANSSDKRKDVWEKRENQYLETINKYNEKEQKQFTEMFAELVKALEYELTWSNAPNDILGPLFHDLELHNKFKGQFFTPQSICDMMAKIIFGDGESAIKDKGFISLCEPACGSGAMVLSMAGVMLEKEFNYSNQLVVEAIDVDLNCVYMCYLQLALYGIPAIVIHGNSLTLEEWSRWYTPVYIWGGWDYRRKNAESIKLTHKPAETESKEEKPFEPKQLSLFEGGE